MERGFSDRDGPSVIYVSLQTTWWIYQWPSELSGEMDQQTDQHLPLGRVTRVRGEIWLSGCVTLRHAVS
jgi:hypothetical protein